MNLFNPLPIPPAILLCYWHPDYEVTPFCASSRLTKKENAQIEALQEIIFFESIESIKQELQAQIETEGGEISHTCEIAAPVIDAKKVVAQWQALPKRFYFYRTEKEQKRFWLYNIQNSDGLPTKTVQKHAIHRQDYLSR